jgi:hypothetical protein
MSRPASVITSISTIDSANVLLPGSRVDAMIEPARAVPSDDPRLETLRDSPEISP